MINLYLNIQCTTDVIDPDIINDLHSISSKNYLYKFDSDSGTDFLFDNNKICNSMIFNNCFFFTIAYISFFIFIATLLRVLSYAHENKGKAPDDRLKISKSTYILLITFGATFVISKFTTTYIHARIMNILSSRSDKFFVNLVKNFNYMYFSPSTLEYLNLGSSNFTIYVSNIIQGYYLQFANKFTYVFPILFLIGLLDTPEDTGMLEELRENKFNNLCGCAFLCLVIIVLNYFAMDKLRTWIEYLKYFIILCYSLYIFGSNCILPYITIQIPGQAIFIIILVFMGTCLYLSYYTYNNIFSPSDVEFSLNEIKKFLLKFRLCYNKYGNINIDKNCEIQEIFVDANEVLGNGEVFNFKTNLNFTKNNFNIFENIKKDGIDITRQLEILYNILSGTYQVNLKKGSVIIKYKDSDGNIHSVDINDLSLQSLNDNFLYLSSKMILPSGLNIYDVISLVGDISVDEVNDLLKQFLLDKEIIVTTDNSHLSGGQRKRVEEMLLYKMILEKEKLGVKPIILLNYYSRGVDFDRQKILLKNFYKFVKQRQLKVSFLPEIQEELLFNEILKSENDKSHIVIKCGASVAEETKADN